MSVFVRDDAVVEHRGGAAERWHGGGSSPRERRDSSTELRQHRRASTPAGSGGCASCAHPSRTQSGLRRTTWASARRCARCCRARLHCACRAACRGARRVHHRRCRRHHNTRSTQRRATGESAHRCLSGPSGARHLPAAGRPRRRERTTRRRAEPSGSWTTQAEVQPDQGRPRPWSSCWSDVDAVRAVRQWAHVRALTRCERRAPTGRRERPSASTPWRSAITSICPFFSMIAGQFSQFE
jgi:hypothetical protein